MEILYAFLVILIIAVSTWLHAYHRRMVAQARLDIARIVLEMDKLMLAGEIKLGDVCHDHVYKAMMAAQRAQKYDIDWSPWARKQDVEKARKFVANMDREMREHPQLKNLLLGFRRSVFCAFRHSRPVMAFVFSLWILTCLIGLKSIMVVLQGILKIHSAQKNWEKFKTTVAESYAGFQILI